MFIRLFYAIDRKDRFLLARYLARVEAKNQLAHNGLPLVYRFNTNGAEFSSIFDSRQPVILPVYLKSLPTQALRSCFTRCASIVKNSP